MNPETNEADALDQRRELREDEDVEVSTVDVEADPADVSDQNRPVPSEEEERPDA